MVPSLLVDPTLASALQNPLSPTREKGAVFASQALAGRSPFLQHLFAVQDAGRRFLLSATHHIPKILFGFGVDMAETPPPAPRYERMSFRARVRRIRNDRVLAIEKAGIDAGLLSHIENGHRMPGPETLPLLAQTLGVPIDVLLTGVPQAMFGPWLKTLRNERGWNRDQFAELLGMHPIHLELLESKVIPSTLKDMRSFARASYRFFGDPAFAQDKSLLAQSDSVDKIFEQLRKGLIAGRELRQWQEPWDVRTPGKPIEIPFRPEGWLEAIADRLTLLEQTQNDLTTLEAQVPENELEALVKIAGWKDREELDGEFQRGLRLFGLALSLASDAYDKSIKHFARAANEDEQWTMSAAHGRGFRLGALWAFKIAKAAKPLVGHELFRSPVLRSVTREAWHGLQDRNDITFGKILRARRKSLGISATQLASKVDVDYTVIVRIEQGLYAARRRPMLEKLATSLGKTYEELIADWKNDFEKEAALKQQFYLLAQKAVQRLKERRKQENWNVAELGRRMGRHDARLKTLFRYGGGVQFDLNLIQDLSDAGLQVHDLWPEEDLIRVYFKPAAAGDREQRGKRFLGLDNPGQRGSHRVAHIIRMALIFVGLGTSFLPGFRWSSAFIILIGLAVPLILRIGKSSRAYFSSAQTMSVPPVYSWTWRKIANVLMTSAVAVLIMGVVFKSALAIVDPPSIWLKIPMPSANFTVRFCVFVFLLGQGIFIIARMLHMQFAYARGVRGASRWDPVLRELRRLREDTSDDRTDPKNWEYKIALAAFRFERAVEVVELNEQLNDYEFQLFEEVVARMEKLQVEADQEKRRIPFGLFVEEDINLALNDFLVKYPLFRKRYLDRLNALLQPTAPPSISTPNPSGRSA